MRTFKKEIETEKEQEKLNKEENKENKDKENHKKTNDFRWASPFFLEVENEFNKYKN